MIVFLLSLAPAIWLGNAFEGPLLESLAPATPLDSFGRHLNAFFHTLCFGLASYVVPVLLILAAIPVFRIREQDYLAISVLSWPLLWQGLRIASGRLLIRRVIRHGPWTLVPAAAASHASPIPLRSSAIVRSLGWFLLLSLGVLGGLLLPYALIGCQGLKEFLIHGTESVMLTFAVLVVGLEAVVAALTAAAGVLFRHRCQTAQPSGENSPIRQTTSRPPRFGLAASIPLTVPWLILWGLFAVPVLEFHEWRNENPIVLWLIIVLSPLGIVHAVRLGWSLGLRHATAFAAMTRALLTYALVVLALGFSLAFSLALLSASADMVALPIPTLLDHWGWSPLGGMITLRPESLPRHTAFLALMVWAVRGFQLALAWIEQRRANGAGPFHLPPSPHPVAGLSLRWPRLLSRNPIPRRTLGLRPHGGHARLTFLRFGFIVAILLLLTSVASVATQGVNPISVPVWGVLGIGGFLAGLAGHGTLAGILGVHIARKARFSGEDHQLHLSLLRGEEIVAGRLAAIFAVTALLAGFLPLALLWPFVLIPGMGDPEPFLILWCVLVSFLGIGGSGGDAAVGLWLGATRRSAVAAGFLAGLWGSLMSIAVSSAAIFGLIYTVAWSNEIAFRDYPDTASFFVGTLGIALAAIPILLRLAAGDWAAQRLDRNRYSTEPPQP